MRNGSAGQKKTKKGEYPHNGSFGRNVLLLLCAMPTMLGFAALWYGLSGLVTPVPYGMPCLLGGGALTLLCVLVGILLPLSRRGGRAGY